MTDKENDTHENDNLIVIGSQLQQAQQRFLRNFFLFFHQQLVDSQRVFNLELKTYKHIRIPNYLKQPPKKISLLF